MGNKQILQQIQENLHSVVKNIQQLADSVGNIATEIEKLNQTVSPKEKTKNAPARKKVIVKNGVVVQIKRVPAIKIVYDIIQKSGKEIDTTELIKKTGFNRSKINNITFRLRKQGQIKNVTPGVYKKV